MREAEKRGESEKVKQVGKEVVAVRERDGRREMR